MKKSKIIVPALGLLLLSTAASVSGTVAWFTANNKYHTTVGSFAVVKTNDDLKVDLTAGVGTKVATDAIQLEKVFSVGDPASDVTFKSKLTDASFDPTAKMLIEPDANGENVKAKTAAADLLDAESSLVRATIDDPEVANDETKIYSCVTWTMTFKVSFGAVATNYALFLDNSDSASKSRFTTTGTTTAKGFRLAFVTSEYTTIWADLQGEDTEHNQLCKYAPNASATVGSALPDGVVVPAANLIDKDYEEDLPAANTAYDTVKVRPDCLGKIAYQANSVVSFPVTCIAYYEGTDPEIRNRDSATEYEAVDVVLDFQIVKVA